MSLRTLTRLLLVAAALILAIPLSWSLAGPLAALAGPALLGLTTGYLALLAGQPAATRWQLRYRLAEGDDLTRLNDVLEFLADRAGHVVVEANAEGIQLQAPRAFDQYVEAQLPRALPEARIRVGEDDNNNSSTGGVTSYLYLGTPNGDLLRWATEAAGRQVRVHVQRGPRTLTVAQARNEVPPGRWLRLPRARVLTRLWSYPPAWDELASDGKLSGLFPPTSEGAVYSSRSPVLALVPPPDYEAAEDDRHLGLAMDGRAVAAPRELPLFTVAAPPDYLAGLVGQDLERGYAVVVVSPHRRALELVQRAAKTAACSHWLDQENSRGSAHLAIVAAGEWSDDSRQLDAAIEAAEGLLRDLGLNTSLPAVHGLTNALIRVLAASARVTGHDFTFADLYAVSQGTQVLKAFLSDVAELPELDAVTTSSLRELQRQIADEAGFVQAVSVLTNVRNVLAPLKTGSLHTLCQPPFTPAAEIFTPGSLLLAPLTNADYPEHNRFVATMLDAVLRLAFATPGNGPRVALHLHDPQLYHPDQGRRWVVVTRRDTRLTLLVDTHDPNQYGQVLLEGQEVELFFRCPERLAPVLAATHGLACPVSDLVDLPANTALARLPDLPSWATVNTGNDR